MTNYTQQLRANSPNPALYLTSSAYLLKAHYQRHMMYGMLVASLAVLLSCLILGFWPASSEIILVPPTDIPPEQIEVDKDFNTKEVIIIPDNPVAGHPGQRQPTGGGTSNIAPNLAIVPDSFVLSDDNQGFVPGGSGPETGDVDVDNWGMPGEYGGTIYVIDTTEYDQFSELDYTPELILMPEPDYPIIAQRIGAEGKVLLHVLVGTDGRAHRVKVHSQTDPNLTFAEAASRAAMNAHFKPAIHNGQPVKCWVSIPVIFEIE